MRLPAPLLHISYLLPKIVTKSLNMCLRLFHHYLCRNRILFICKFPRESIRIAQCKTVAIRASKCGLCIPLSFSLFGLLSTEETPEDKFITTIKRSILCIDREQYDKAEQMLHLALRMAQDLQSEDGITYVYDIMANLAFEREQFKKAENLFAEVIKRLLANGLTEDNPKILHISAKIAHMAQLEGNLEKARMGFEWTVKKLEECAIKIPGDPDMQELWGLTQNWFGMLLMKMKRYDEAKQRFQFAYDCCIKVHGTSNEECIMILNNLSVACVNLDDFAEAKLHIEAALQFARLIKDCQQEGVLLANLGLIYLKEGLIDRAKSTCADAWRISRSTKSDAAVNEAEHCLNEIKAYGKNSFKTL